MAEGFDIHDPAASGPDPPVENDRPEAPPDGESPSTDALTGIQRAILEALCRPLADGARHATPATNRQIGEEVFLSVDAVKAHLRALYAKLGVDSLPQNKKRARLAELALSRGLVFPGELDQAQAKTPSGVQPAAAAAAHQERNWPAESRNGGCSGAARGGLGSSRRPSPGSPSWRRYS